MVTCEVLTYHTCFVNLSLMKTESKIKEISSMFLSQLYNPPLNLKRILEDICKEPMKDIP